MTEKHTANKIETRDESLLIEQAKNEPEAFGFLYEKYVQRIYNYIYYRTGNHNDAEDWTAKTFQRAMKHIPRYEQRGVPFSAWLYRIAHNVVANWHRDQSRRPVVPLDERLLASGGAKLPESEAITEEERSLLLTAVRRLAPDRQQLLILKYVQHLSNAEVAQIMGRTEGAIKSLYHRTLNALRDELKRILKEGIRRGPQAGG